MLVRARYDKHGRQLPDTGRGCGCNLCEAANAARYERRHNPERAGGQWSGLRRRVMHLFRNYLTGPRSQLA